MLKRFTISLEEDLLVKFDKYSDQHGYGNRSEAIRDLIRKSLVKEEWKSDNLVIGVVSLVYDHHKSQLQEKITEVQHKYYEIITSTTHIHMDHDNCLEVTIVKGKASQVQKMAGALMTLRGVKDGNLTMSSTGGDLY